jgi:hypothetical protein
MSCASSALCRPCGVHASPSWRAFRSPPQCRTTPTASTQFCATPATSRHPRRPSCSWAGSVSRQQPRHLQTIPSHTLQRLIPTTYAASLVGTPIMLDILIFQPNPKLRITSKNGCFTCFKNCQQIQYNLTYLTLKQMFTKVWSLLLFHCLFIFYFLFYLLYVWDLGCIL